MHATRERRRRTESRAGRPARNPWVGVTQQRGAHADRPGGGQEDIAGQPDEPQCLDIDHDPDGVDHQERPDRNGRRAERGSMTTQQDPIPRNQAAPATFWTTPCRPSSAMRRAWSKSLSRPALIAASASAYCWMRSAGSMRARSHPPRRAECRSLRQLARSATTGSFWRSQRSIRRATGTRQVAAEHRQPQAPPHQRRPSPGR